MNAIYFELLVDSYTTTFTYRILGFSKLARVPLSSCEISRSRGLPLDLATVVRMSTRRLRTTTTHLRRGKCGCWHEALVSSYYHGFPPYFLPWWLLRLNSMSLALRFRAPDVLVTQWLARRFPWYAYIGAWGFSEMILANAPGEQWLPLLFNVRTSLVGVFEVSYVFLGFHCYLPTVLVPVLPITFFRWYAHNALWHVWDLEIFMEVLCTQTLLLYYATPDQMLRLRLSMVSSDRKWTSFTSWGF